MSGPELTRTEGGLRRGDHHLSTVLAHGKPALTTDVELAAALARAVMEAS